MAETYELWSLTSHNLVGDFASEAEAFAAVRAAYAEHGPEYAAGLALGHEDRRGRTRPIAQGATLVERALAATPAAAPSPAVSPDRAPLPPRRAS
jgi:hypothetical protein